MSLNIYVGFYTRVGCKVPCTLLQWLDYLIYLGSGPFTHCILCLDNSKLPTRITIDKQSNTVLYGKISLENQREGYSYVRIPVSPSEFRALEQIMTRITSHPTTFDFYGMFGIIRNTETTNTDKKQWFCSTLIAFLLREIGILHQHIDVAQISVTELYLLIRQSTSKTRVMEQLTIHPYRKIAIETSDITYANYRGIDVIEIPILDIQNFKGR